MRNGQPFQIGESRRYRVLANSLSLGLATLGVCLLWGGDVVGLAVILASGLLWQAFRRSDPSGISLWLPADKTFPPREQDVTHWCLRSDVAQRPMLVTLNVRGAFRVFLWLEVSAPNFGARRGPRLRPKLMPLLLFDDAMEQADWRGLRRALKMQSPALR